jgi:DsbE subfamily thiol:disulfide oxidoreductase
MIKSILILVSFLIITLCTAYSNDIEHFQIAQKDLPSAENFSLDSLNDDGNIEFDDFKGKPVVINLWATWCGPCKEEMPLLEKMWNKHKATGVVFIGVDVMDDKNSAAEFIKKMRVTYLNLYDPSGEVLHKYGVSGLPATFFINRDGKIAFKSYGPFLGDEGETKFESYLKGIAK